MGGFLACILAGAAMSIQGVMNTRLSEHIGTMETNAFVQCVAAVLSLLVLVFWRTGSFAALGAAPKYCWFGGVLALDSLGISLNDGQSELLLVRDICQYGRIDNWGLAKVVEQRGLGNINKHIRGPKIKALKARRL